MTQLDSKSDLRRPRLRKIAVQLHEVGSTSISLLAGIVKTLGSPTNFVSQMLKRSTLFQRVPTSL